MKTHVLLSPHNVDELYFTGKTSVVIDVLRATTVIVQALNANAKEIIPVGSVDFAMKISGNSHGGHTLLCGERNTKMIEGFNLGNSPLEYTEEIVSGKSIILFTTNGSKSIVRAKFSESLFICSFNNLSAVAQHLVSLDKDVEILTAGSNGMFCIEDTVCAGKLIQEMSSLKPDLEISDSARASLILNDQFGGDIHEMLKNCEHGKLLIENGYSEDLEFCSKTNTTSLVPVFVNGSIKTVITDEDENKNE